MALSYRSTYIAGLLYFPRSLRSTIDVSVPLREFKMR